MPVSSRGKVSLAVLEAGSEAMKEPPRTEIERVVVACAEAVLRIEPIGLHDDLIALGADSLDLMALAVRLEDALGIGFAPSVIIANPTPAALASVVNSGSVDLETLPRVVAGDAAQPLVLVSGGGGGEIEAMTSLARLIGDRDAYVAVPKGFESRAFPDRSVEAMARRIVGDVERLGLRHVTLIGHSSGGPVAFEAARQLTAMGNHPTGIVLLDTGWPRDRAERMRATRAAAAATGTPLHAAARNARAVIRPRRWWWVASAGLVQRRGRERWDVFSVLRERALARYRPQPYVGAAVVFHASDPSESDKGAGSERWRSVITPRPDSRDVPGNHSSLVRPPYSTATAAALRDVLAAWRRVDHPDRVAGTH